MVTCPVTHAPSTTVAELRAFFGDDHVHMALLLDGGRLVGTVERDDLSAHLGGDTASAGIARIDGRTTAPDADLSAVLASMKRDGRRRLAVVSRDGELVGLLCLKAGGEGFCSDAGVRSRHQSSRAAHRGGPVETPS